jgi:hypothetical protein
MTTALNGAVQLGILCAIVLLLQVPFTLTYTLRRSAAACRPKRQHDLYLVQRFTNTVPTPPVRYSLWRLGTATGRLPGCQSRSLAFLGVCQMLTELLVTAELAEREREVAQLERISRARRVAGETAAPHRPPVTSDDWNHAVGVAA